MQRYHLKDFSDRRSPIGDGLNNLLCGLKCRLKQLNLNITALFLCGLKNCRFLLQSNKSVRCELVFYIHHQQIYLISASIYDLYFVKSSVSLHCSLHWSKNLTGCWPRPVQNIGGGSQVEIFVDYLFSTIFDYTKSRNNYY